MNTVNVIEFRNGLLQRLVAFADDAEGNDAAEKLFTEIGNSVTRDHDICASSFIDDGYYNTGERLPPT